jgi:peptide/nickel transport system substrate-binding protein
MPSVQPQSLSQKDQEVDDVTSRRRSKALISLFAMAAVGALVASNAVSATTVPPGTEPAGTEAPAGSAPAGGAGEGEVGGSGCGTPHGPYEDPGDPAGEVRVAWNDPPLSMNNNTIHSNALAITNVRYLMDAGGFNYFDADLNLINNDQFGTCTIESLDPLTITYRINPGVTWTDGVQADAADMLLFWASQSTVYNDENTVNTPEGESAEGDENGMPIVVGPDGADITSVDEEAYAAAFDPETGALLEGFTYKEATGVAFDAADPFYQLATQLPVISEDGLALTITFDSFYADYRFGAPVVGQAAHVVAGRALGIEDPAEAKQALIDAFTNDDAAAIKPIADFFNTGFDTTSLPDDPGLYLSTGPYNLTGYTEVSELTFEAREDYTWGPQPQIQTIVYRIIGDPTAAVQAMENEEIDMIQPQATSDLLVQLEALADRGIEVTTGDGATFEHVDLAINNGGPFDPAAYGGDEATALAVRQAFLKTIPRQEIVDRLIVPLNANATIRNSYTQVPGSAGYDAISATNGMSAYDTVDIAGAQALLEEAGVTTPVQVRFHYAANNPRRASEYELIRDSAAQAGFEVLDGNSPTWSAELSNTDIYDAAMFGWISTTTGLLNSEANYVTDGANNFYGYSNEEVDAAWEEIQVTTDADAQLELAAQVEAQLVEDAFGVSIFQFPEVLAWNSTYVSGADAIPLAPAMFYAFWDWQAVG